MFMNALGTFVFFTLIALGLMVIFGMMKIINMAHGEFFMLGAFVAWACVNFGLGFWIGLILAPIIVSIIGMSIEKLIIRKLYKIGELSTLLATWGLSLAITQIVTLMFGGQPRFMPNPLPFRLDLVFFTYPAYHVFAILVGIAIIVSTVLLFFKTKFGVMARATIQNAEMASALGINTSRMYLLTFGLGTGLAAAAGALMSPMIAVKPAMGIDFLARSFFIVILGGLGNIPGTVAAGAVVGGSESMLTSLLPLEFGQGGIFSSPAVLAQTLVLIMVALLMLIRPEGLFVKRR